MRDLLSLSAVVFVLFAVITVRRPVAWRQLRTPAVAVLALAAFGVLSWILSVGLGGVGSGLAWLTTAAHVPPLVLILSPLLLAAGIGWLNHSRMPRPAMTTERVTPGVSPAAVATLANDDAPKHEEDQAWYSSDWRRDPDNPDHDPGTEGYRLELQGGPLAGRTARLRDSRFRLWVLRTAAGERAVRGALALFADDVPAGATIEGSYGFSHGDEAMVWRSAEGSSQ